MYFQSTSGCEYLLITPDRSLVFPSVEYVRNVVSKAGMKQGSSSVPVVIDSRHIQGADFTAAKVSNTLIETAGGFFLLQCRLKCWIPKVCYKNLAWECCFT
jgi:sodium-independent sulfate anion transporter 11